MADDARFELRARGNGWRAEFYDLRAARFVRRAMPQSLARRTFWVALGTLGVVGRLRLPVFDGTQSSDCGPWSFHPEFTVWATQRSSMLQ
jgi:hypothetical protein